MIVLNPSFVANMGTRERHILDLINRWDLEHIKAIVLKHYPYPDFQVDQAVSEFQKFVFLVQLDFEDLMLVSRQVNVVWKAVTADIEDKSLLNNAFGNFVDYTHFKDWGMRQFRLATRFRQVYQLVFGIPTPVIWYPS